MKHPDFHATWVWLAAIPIAYLFGWLYSLLFISACSIYANAAGHWAAYRGDRALHRLAEQLDRIETLLQKSRA